MCDKRVGNETNKDDKRKPFITYFKGDKEKRKSIQNHDDCAILHEQKQAKRLRIAYRYIWVYLLW